MSECGICKFEVSDGKGIDCGECGVMFHYSCTRCSLYHIFLMKNYGDVPYKCQKCTNEKFSTFESDIEDLRALLKTQSLEIEALKNPPKAKKAEKSKKSDGKSARDMSKPTPAPKESEDSEPEPKQPERPKNYKTKVCKYFVSKKLECKHGDDCTYIHPSVCNDHKKGPHGCKTKNCKKLHPDFCQNSINLMQCLNKDCKLLHIGGTIRNVKKNTQNRNRNTNAGYPLGYYPHFSMNPLPYYANNNYGYNYPNFPNVPVQPFPQLNPFLGQMGFMAGAPPNAFPMNMQPTRRPR